MSKVENSVRAWTSGFGVSFSDMPLDEMVMRGARYVTAVTKELLYPDRAPEYNDPSIKVRLLAFFGVLCLLYLSITTRLEDRRFAFFHVLRMFSSSKRL